MSYTRRAAEQLTSSPRGPRRSLRVAHCWRVYLRPIYFLGELSYITSETSAETSETSEMFVCLNFDKTREVVNWEVLRLCQLGTVIEYITTRMGEVNDNSEHWQYLSATGAKSRKTAGSRIQERCNFTFETPFNRLLILQSELLVLRFRLIQLHKDKKYRGKSIVSG